MSLSLGIVGLPNVGKSTLFNALTKLNILAANYPFATIEPNVGVVHIEDERLDTLTEISSSEEKIPTTIEFVDIAGLVKGASEGEGLGNKFLGHIKQVAAIAHIVRLFDDENVIHVDQKVDPKSDIEVIHSELILKDIETVTNRIESLEKQLKSKKDRENEDLLEILKKAYNHLNNGGVLIELISKEETQLLHDLHLITLKPMIFIANISEGQVNLKEDEIKKMMGLKSDSIVLPICIKMESELIQLSLEEQADYLESVGLKYTGLQRLAQAGYKLLNLITFFTTGPKESRAWTIQKGTVAREAAGVIHTDFTKNFISMEVIKYNDFIQHQSWQACKDKGKVSLEGKDYIVQDGDIVVVKHN